MTPAPTASLKRGYVASLTGLRGMAAIWVFVYHAWVFSGPRSMRLALPGVTLDLTPFFSCGWAGVQLFFVLSGFLLALPFAEFHAGRGQPVNILPYLARRVRRVFPAYYAQLGLLLLAAFLSGHNLPFQFDEWQVARHALMLFIPIPLDSPPSLNGVWWTLPIEFSFYLVLPMLAIWLRPDRIGRLVVLALAIMVAWRWGTVSMLGNAPVPIRVSVASQLPGSMDSFALGMLAAMAHVHREALAASRWGRLVRALSTPAVAAAGLVGCLYWIHWHHQEYWTSSALFFLWTPLFNLALAGIVLACAERRRWADWVFGNGVSVYLGTISYSLYLWHFPVLEAVRDRVRLPGGHSGMEDWWLPAALTLLAASLSYRYVERPFLARRRPAMMHLA